MRYFKPQEFACKCGCGEREMRSSTIDKLERARELANIPFIITSGKRCEGWNKAVGGKSQSAHTRGYAVDIKATDSRSRWLIVEALISAGFTRIGFASSFIHADNDPSLPQEVMWDY